MSEKYELIAAECAEYDTAADDAVAVPTLKQMFTALEVSKSGYYEWFTRAPSATPQRRDELKLKITALFENFDGTYGYRRIHAEPDGCRRDRPAPRPRRSRAVAAHRPWCRDRPPGRRSGPGSRHRPRRAAGQEHRRTVDLPAGVRREGRHRRDRARLYRHLRRRQRDQPTVQRPNRRASGKGWRRVRRRRHHRPTAHRGTPHQPVPLRPGESAGSVAELFAGTPVRAHVLADARAGAASALKMAFASYQKIRRTLAGVAHALAAEYSVTDELLAEGSGTALAELDQLPSVAARAWRWAPEMLEIADTLEATALPAELAQAAAEVLQRWDADKDTELPVAEVLAHLSTHGDVEPET